MQWKFFTRQVPIEGGVVLRWFWRKPVLEGREESPVGFLSRGECEADAARHGFQRAAEPPSRRSG